MQNWFVVFQLLVIIILIIYIFKFKWFFLKRAFYKHFPKVKKDIDKPYTKFKFFDKAPIIASYFIKSYTEFLDCFLIANSKALKPVNSNKVPAHVICPYCNAPHSYIYDNNGGKGQYLCKVCNHTFCKTQKFIDAPLLCPYCNCTLQIAHDRADFISYKCINRKCSCYLNNLSKLSTKQLKEFKEQPYKFSLHYIYRISKFEFPNLLEPNTKLPINNLGSIRSSYFTLGLVLTYKYNYGLSARKISALLYDVHEVKLSHSTIITYCKIVAPIVKFFLDNFKYDVSGNFCGDETYVKVKGKWTYVIFFFDSVKKIILSHDVFDKRNTEAAFLSLNTLLTKVYSFCKEVLVVTDANPIYNVAHMLFKQSKIIFKLVQVIGLTNKDEISAEYRPFKQIIERLNRTFKEIYKPTCGYESIEGAKIDVILFSACYNFLRPNVALDYKVPVEVTKIQCTNNMPTKWCQLINCALSMIEHT